MSAEKFYWQGKKLFDEEKYGEALKVFHQALQQEELHTLSLYGRALSYFKLQRFDESIQDFDKLINLIPNNATYLSERGVALHLSGDNETALKDFDKAVRLEPENPYRYSSRAYIKDRMQVYQGAIDDYTKAIELDPEDAISYNNRGLVEEKLGYKDKAKKNFDIADKLMPAKPREEQVQQQQATDKNGMPEIRSEKKPRFKQYLSVMGSVFTSRQNLKEFVDFVGDKLKSGK
jgi:tetratricopeptide (TPR) repeat protein